VLCFDKDAAIKSAAIEEELSGKGNMINKTDIFIAGICITKNMPIVTLDNHFKKIPGLKTVPI
jgi:predicted nucleic acid-binding protein